MTGLVTAGRRSDTAITTLTVLVMAKSPVPGQVKTRLCPPLHPGQAASVAAAALLDTMDVVAGFAGHGRVVVRPTLALAGNLTDAPDGPAVAGLMAGPGHRWARLPQRGADFSARLVNAHVDTRRQAPGGAVLQIGMDTPQLTVDLLTQSVHLLDTPGVDAVLGPTVDGGWWALGLRDPRAATVLSQVRMSTAGTGTATLRALRAAGLRTVLLPPLTDVDTIADADEVAALIPHSRFAAALAGVRDHRTTLSSVVRESW